jgi:catechol 2,3-dioxygenase-like lactoylglutathione lyase family enzyme
MQFGYTIIYVPDVAASLAFFTRAVGLARRFLHESGTYGELETGAAQFIAVCRRSKTMSMGLRRPRKGSRLCRRCALPRRSDTPRLRQILPATKCDTLSDLSASPHREHYRLLDV